MNASERRFLLLVEAVEDYAIYMLDPEGRVVTWNPGAERSNGYKSEEILGQHFGCFFLPEDEAAGVPLLELAEAARVGRFAGEGWRQRKDGGRFWASVVITAIRGQDEELIGFANVTRDLTERKEREDVLRASEEALHAERDRLKITLHSIGDGVISTDQNGCVTLMNPAAEKMTGWSMDEATGRPVEEVLHLIEPESGRLAGNPVRQCLTRGSVVHLQEGVVMIDRHGELRAVRDSAAPIRAPEGAVVGAILVFQDVTHLQHVLEELRFQASHDVLTGLPNRRQFEAKLQEVIRDAGNEESEHTLCFLDLDRFKIINDTAGHAVGDLFLRTMSQTIRHHVRRSDFVARLGGDEFAVILFRCRGDEASEHLSKLVEAIASLQFQWEDRAYTVTASIGATAITPETDSASHAMRQADVACYAAKRAGRNRISFYRPGQSESTAHHRELHMVGDIRQALTENRFRLFAQKIVSTRESADQHYELLLRMIDSEGEMILPAHFIPAAERYDMMAEIDRWVMREALERLAENLAAIPNLWLNINLSAQSLNDPKFLGFFMEVIERSKLQPERLTFEITETALINNFASAAATIDKVQSMGCRIALDDFGAGLSSFNYLRSFRADIIKMEGTFIRNMLRNPVDMAIVKSINQIAHEIGAQTVAECVEDIAMLDALRILNVDFAQGFGAGRPEPIENLFGLTVPG